MNKKTYALLGALLFLVASASGCVKKGFQFPFKSSRVMGAGSITKVCEFAAIDVSASSGGKNGTQFKNYVQALRRQMESPACGTRYVVFHVDEKVENDDILLDVDVPNKSLSELGMGCLQKKSAMEKALSPALNELTANAPGSDLIGLLWLMEEASEVCDAVNITVYSDLFIHTKSLNTNFIIAPAKNEVKFYEKKFSKHILPKFRSYLVKNFTVVRHTQGVQPEVVRWTEKLWKNELLPRMGIHRGVISFKLVTQNTL